MTKPIQENLDEQFKRKIPQTHNIMLSTRNNYNVTHDHNYHRKNKKKCQRPNRQKYLNHSEILINDPDGYGTLPEWCAIDVSSDEEHDDNMPLSEILRIEFEKDLLHEYRNKNCKYNSSQLDKNQIHG